MTGRFVWVEDAHLRSDDALALAVTLAYANAPPDPIAAFIEATRDRWIFGDAEWATETISLGLRALGRP